jgi:hypothetical protein
LETAETGAVKAELQPVVASLSTLYHACAAGAVGAKKKESDDNNKRLAHLFYKLNQGDISESVSVHWPSNLHTHTLTHTHSHTRTHTHTHTIEFQVAHHRMI